MRRLVLLRHGQTAWNYQQRAQGQTDVPLDETGLAQATAVAPRVAEFAPSRIVSSDLQRARRTADAVAARCGVAVRDDDRLREFHLGERQGMTLAEFGEAFPDQHRSYLEGRLDAVPGAETTDEVRKRLGAALGDVVAELPMGECAVVVSHGAALRVAVVDFLGLPEEATALLRAMDNCAWVELVETDPPEPRWRLAVYNGRADF